MSLEHCRDKIRQPNWGPGHVRSAAELEEGRTYVHHEVTLGPRISEGGFAFITSGPKRTLEVMGLSSNGLKSVHASVHEGRVSGIRDISFADLGFRSHAEGGRTKWDWLEDPSRTTPSLMDKLLSAYPEYFSPTLGGDSD